MMHTLKKHFVLLTVAISLATTGLLTQETNAAYNSALTFPTCALSIHPFNTEGTVVNDLANQWFNIFTGSSTCTQHLQYPNQYTPQPPTVQDNPLKNVNGVENIHAPTTRHNHVYHNASVEDNFWYKSYMAKFQIILEPDALNNTDKFNVVCGTPTGPGTYVETPGCNGTVGNWGTTSISYNSSTGVITWDFAEGSSKTGRPMLWGENPSLNKPHGYLGAYVKLVSKDNPQEVWSATTTSRALIRDLALLKSSDDDGDAPSCANDGQPGNQKDYDGNWCTMNPPNISGVEATEMNDGKQYYWYRIGVVGTTWKKPTPELAACTGLDLSITQGGNIYSPNSLTGLQPDQAMTLNVTPSFDGQPFPLKYEWSGLLNAQPQGEFRNNQITQTGSNPFTDLDTTTFYTGGPANTVVRVRALDENDQPVNCEQSFTIPEAPNLPICTGIDLQPNLVNAPGTTNYTATLTFSDGQQHESTVGWTGNGTFSNGTSQTEADNSFQNSFTTPNQNATVHVSVTNVAPGALNSPVCQEGVTVPPDAGMCVALTANYSTPVAPGDTITINPQVQYQGNVQPDEIQWSENGDGSFSPIPNHATIQPWCPLPGGSSFTAPYTCRYRYTAVTAGDTFTLEANPNPTSNPACILEETVEEEGGICEYLNFLPPENGEICIDVDPNFTGDFEWTINGTTTTTSDICQPYDANSSYSVEAVGAPQCADEFSPEDECTYFEFEFPGDEICVDTDYEGDVEWIFNGGEPETTNEEECFTYNPAFSYEAAAVNTSNPECKAAIPPEESELVKKAARTPGDYSTQIITLSPDDSTIYYELTYVPLNNQKYSTTIVDTISENGYIEAQLLPQGSGEEPGRITYDSGSMRVIVNGQEIDSCQEIVANTPEGENPVIEDCYVGDVGNGGVHLVEVMGEARISYTGSVDSSLTQEACQEGTICQEKYVNSAETENSIVHVDEDNDEEIPEVNSNPITVQKFCQYILTRAAGDIFLENDLSTGIDINQCSIFRSSTGIIITPGEEDTPPLVSTGAGDTTIFSVGHEVCTAGQAGLVDNELAELYGSDITGLSSQICEVKLRAGTGSPWKQEVITNSIDENKTRASRWGADPSLGNNLANMLFSFAEEDVYHVQGNVSSGNIRMDEVGAKTFIIEDGDLHITDNIVYTGSCPAGPGQCSVRDVASLAFIVLNGSIYVDPDVTAISGVYFVQEGDRAGSGRLYSGSPEASNQQSDEQLVVYGSVYGDIDPLFAERFFSGDPSSDLGGIVVRFDQRVILNTPPALRDILSLSQSEVAR